MKTKMKVNFLKILFKYGKQNTRIKEPINHALGIVSEILINDKRFIKLFYFIQSLLNCVPCVLKTCSRTKAPYILTCLRANMSCVFTCPRVNVSCVLTCPRANVPCVLTCSRANVHFVLTCQSASFNVTISVSLPLLLKLHILLIRFKSLITVFPQ